MKLNADQIRSYKTDGFLLLRNVLPKTFLEDIRKEAKSCFLHQLTCRGYSLSESSTEKDFEQALYRLFNDDYDAFVGAAKLCQHAISLFRLSASEEVIGSLREVGVEQPAICVKPIIYFNSRHISKIAGHYKTPAHQDWRSMQGSLNSVVVWIPLIDIDRDLGALEVIPGSHLMGLLPTEQDEWFRHVRSDSINETEFVPLEVEAGDLVLFSSFLVHRSGNNSTESIRWSMHYRYNDAAESSWIERKFVHPYKVYHPDQEIISEDFPSLEQLKDIF
jgi:phytanoyl-CoA hydroxylase